MPSVWAVTRTRISYSVFPIMGNLQVWRDMTSCFLLIGFVGKHDKRAIASLAIREKLTRFDLCVKQIKTVTSCIILFFTNRQRKFLWA